MTLKSMTGFGRADGVRGSDAWHWEVRSVNGRSLEVRSRVPSGLEALELANEWLLAQWSTHHDRLLSALRPRP